MSKMKCEKWDAVLRVFSCVGFHCINICFRSSQVTW